MNRLRVLKQRAARGLCGVCKLNDGWWVGCGKGWGDCTGPFASKREALLVAARWALPSRKVKITVTYDIETYNPDSFCPEEAKLWYPAEAYK